MLSYCCSIDELTDQELQHVAEMTEYITRGGAVKAALIFKPILRQRLLKPLTIIINPSISSILPDNQYASLA
jgi:hypothetical protein